MRLPSATYRLQLGRSMTFADLQRFGAYLQMLGATECYCSPILAARAGSPHGYDISDHAHLNPELGDRDTLRAAAAALRARDIGLIVDFVPNHMGADAATNRWWRDVLEHGPSSPFARFFDIDWHPAKPELRNKVLLPILGGPYGDVLARGELRLDFVEGALALRYFERTLPIEPKQGATVFAGAMAARPTIDQDLSPGIAEFRGVLALLAAMPDYTSTSQTDSDERQRVGRLAGEQLSALVDRDEIVRHLVADAIAPFNGHPGEAASFDRLHELLDRQPYRLAFWRTALDEINYRRFFDVNDLAGIRVEDPRVFAAAHALLLDLVEEGSVTGIRIDHPDGLFDPTGYLRQLRQAAADRLPDAGELYLVVEKVLGRDERLRESWPVQGTTGYNALATLNGVFIHPQGLTELRRAYRRFTRRQRTGAETAHAGRDLMMRTALASELNVLIGRLSRLAESDRRFRDFTFNTLRRVLMEVIAGFPVYRTYVNADGAAPEDAAIVDAAIGEARRRNPLQEPSIFEFIRQVLLPATTPESAGASLAARQAFAQKFQQYTGPVTAKGLEDTAFYDDVLLLSANEVGSDLVRRVRSVADLHEDNLRRLADWPLEMTAASTHDTKRGEDARARINVLSELSDDWRLQVAQWAALNRPAHSEVNGAMAPDRNDEWLFYQSLVGAWPAESLDARVPEIAPSDLVERMRAFMHKAIKEAKRHTSWLYENKAYEEAVDGFVERVLTGVHARRFLSSFVPFTRRISFFGMLGSLAHVVLRIGAPGVPDIYQGSELWNLSLVDPDNRRPIDPPTLCRLLMSLEPLLSAAEMTPVPAQWRADGDDRSIAVTPPGSRMDALAEIFDRWPDGRVKLFTTAAALRLRRADRDLFLKGAYAPLVAQSPADAHVVAYSRRYQEREAIVAAPRFMATLHHGQAASPLGVECWDSGSLALPPRLAGARLVNVFTGETLEPVERNGEPFLRLASVFRSWPAAILWVHEPA